MQIQPGPQRKPTILRQRCTGGQLLLAKSMVPGSLLDGSDEIQAAPPRFDAETHGKRCPRTSDGVQAHVVTGSGMMITIEMM